MLKLVDYHSIKTLKIKTYKTQQSVSGFIRKSEMGSFGVNPIQIEYLG